MFTVGAIIDRPQPSAKPKGATNGRPYKRTSAENMFSLPICDIMILVIKMDELKKRKTPRYQSFDYNSVGVYFITICTQNRRCILSRIVGTGVPTNIEKANSVCSQFVSTFKRFCNKEYGENIWQARFNDHIIRNREDYEEHLQYIYENPIRWCYDELYAEE